MAQVLRLTVLVLLGLGGLAAAADFTPAEAEAAREGLLEVLDTTVTGAASKMDEFLDLPPSISETVRTVAFVRVDTVKEAKNIKMSRMSTLHRGGATGVDPIASGKPVAFTVPLELDAPHLTGELLRKVNDVGPTGHFNTTIGIFRLEAEGTATVSRDACSFNFTAVKDTEINGVDTTVEGASLLNRVLASDMSDIVRSGKLPLREPVARAILDKLQAQPTDCLASVRAKLDKVPAAPASAA